MTQEDLIAKQNADIFSVVKTGLPPIAITSFQFTTQGLDPMEGEAKRVVEESLAKQQKILADRIKSAEQQQASTQENSTVNGEKYTPINQGATANNNTNSGEYDLDGIQRWMDKSAGGKAPLTASQIYDSAKKYDVPFELALAQAQQEGNFGKDKNAKPYKTKNLWNVGNVDSGAINNQNSFEEGLDTYMSLFSRKYGNSKDQERLLNNFTNKNGNRYATDVNYEKSLKAIIDKNIAPYRKTTSIQVQQPAATPIIQTTQQGDSGFNISGLPIKFLRGITSAKGGYAEGRITPVLFDRNWIEGGAIQSSPYDLRNKPSETENYNLNSNGLQMNLGVDLVPKKGIGARIFNQTDVKGEVTRVVTGAPSGRSQFNGGYGNQVTIKYTFPDGKTTYQEFNHLQGTDLKVGQVLTRGQEIAKVGATGNMTGPHLDASSYIISRGKRVYQNPEGSPR
jgi:murein DD-endopeptidase MepM/ murein hydrolase activator NlpD